LRDSVLTGAAHDAVDDLIFEKLSILRPNRRGRRAVRATEHGSGAAGNPIVCVGGSHTAAVAAAARRFGENVRIVNLNAFRKPFLGADGPYRLHRAVIRSIGTDGRRIFSMVGGNTHNVMGLVRHPRPFDFVLPGEPDLPLDPAAEILPYEAVKAVLERRAEPILRQIEALAVRYAGRLSHVESPPPVTEAEILGAPSNFKDQVQRYGVAPAMLRYRLWRLHTAVIRAFCQRFDVPFVTVPPESMDRSGFLLPSLTGNVTHGNAHYGVMVLARMKAAAA